MEWLVLIPALMMLLIVCFALYSICNPPASISSYELDETTCWQMRESGWTETEIEEWMDANGGYYHPPMEVFIA